MASVYSLDSLSDRIKKLQIATIGWYQFNDATNLKKDSSANNNDLINGANIPVLNTNIYKTGTGSIEFDGTVDRSFNIPTALVKLFDTINANGLCIMLWMNLTPGINSATTIINFSITENGVSASLSIERDANGSTLNLKYSKQTVQTLPILNMIDNKWHHIAWNISSSGMWTIYVDSVYVNTTIETPLDKYNTPSSETYKIGGQVKGYLDDLRIYRRVLTNFEIEIIYNLANVNNIFTDNGNVGIGTNVMTNKLNVNGSINASNYLVNGLPLSSNIWSSLGSSIYTSNNVGIGTTSPSQKLEVWNGDIMISGGDIYNDTVKYQSERWKVDNNNNISYTNGNVGIGTNAAVSSRLYVSGNILVNGGQIVCTSNIIAYDSISDDRLKTRIGNVTGSLDYFRHMSVFKYKTDNDLAISHGFNSNLEYYGMSAQEVQQYYPEVIKIAGFDTAYVDGEVKSKSGNNYLSIAYEKLVPVLVKAIQELHKKYEDVKTRINQLKINRHV